MTATSRRRAMAFALFGLVSFTTLLWYAREMGYDLSNVRGLRDEVDNGTNWRETPKLKPGENETTCACPTTCPCATTDSGHAAVVIETSITANLIPLMLHFSNMLGSSWPVILFTLQKGWALPPSSAFRRALREGRVQVRYLPPDTDMSSNQAVSGFLASPWLWEQLSGFDRVLMFQTDSVLCSHAQGSVDDWLKWDFVGAPIGGKIPDWAGRGFNGGLSLRNPKLFLDIANQGGFDPNIDHPQKHLRYEDQWFYQKLTERNSTRLPTMDKAKEFSVETVYYEKPLGYHQPQRWQSAHMEQIEDYCPEVTMMLKRRIHDSKED